MKNFWSTPILERLRRKIRGSVIGFATLMTVLALSTIAQAAPLSGQPNVSLDFNETGQTANYTVGFTTTTPVGGDFVRDGKIKVDFPAGFDISSASLAALPPPSLLGSVDNLSIVGQSLSFQFHHDGGLPGGSTVSFGINGVINPAISGNYHLVISTLQIDNSLVDGATNSFDFSIQPRGPNQANSTIDTNPSGITTMTVGSTVSVVFTAKDSNNVVMPNQEVLWSRSNTNFGISSPSGTTNVSGQNTITLTAPITPGESTNVTAESGGIVTHVTLTTASIITTHDVLHHWGISNVSTPQTAGSFFDIFVTPYDQYNNVITNYDWSNLANRPVFSGLNSVGGNEPCYNYTSDAGGIATYSITPYAAQTNANITLTLGIANGISNNFNVNHSTATLVTISPLDDTVIAGNTKTYTTTAHDTYGNTWNATTDSFFDIDFAAHGSWSSNVYTSETAGDFTVTAHYGSLTDFTSLHVDPSVLHHIIITTTDPTTITAGQTVQFSAAGYDQYNNVISGLTFTWDYTDANGLFSNTTAGTYPVRAHSGGIDSDIENVTVEPAALDHITISTTDPTTITAGQTVNFVAHSYDIYGNERTVDTFTWSGTSAIDSGIFNDTSAGNIHDVYAMSNGISSNHINVIVNHSTATSIAINPIGPINLTADGTQQFVATAIDIYGNDWVATNEVTWSDTDPVGSVDTAGLYSASQVGTWIVTATLNGHSESVTVNVSHGVATSVVVTPTPVNLTADDTQQFITTATDADGNSWIATTEATWSDSDPIGSVNTTGLYSAGQVGTWTVTATLNGHSDSATVNVSHGQLYSISLSPASNTITADQTQTYTLTAFDADGNSWDVTNDPSVIYSIESEAGGSWTGNIYNPHTAGTWTVTASLNVKTATATLIVEAGITTNISISPSDSQIATAGEDLNFIAIAYDQFGNPTGDAVSWSGATNGVFNQTIAGPYTVYVYIGTIESAHVSITVFAADVASIVISTNDPTTISAGEYVQFYVIAYDQYGNEELGLNELSFTWDNTNPTGFFSNPTAGSYNVQAHFGSVGSNIITVTVNHAALDHIVITPNGSTTVAAGNTLQFNVVGYDYYDNVISGLTFTWDNTDSNGLFSQTTAGNYTVQAHSGGVNSNSVTVTVVHGSASSISISPTSYDFARSGLTHVFTAIASDQYGNTWDATSWATFSLDATDAFGSLNGNTYTAGQIGTHHVIVTYQTRTASATVNVSDHATTVSSIQITNNIIDIMVGATHAYQVRFKDAYGNSWDGTSQVIWSILPTGNATIDSNGVLTGTLIGSGIVVTATYGTKHDTDTFSVIAAVGGTTSKSSSTGSDSVTTANDSSQVIVGDDQGKVKGTEITTIGADQTEAAAGGSFWPTLGLIIFALLLLAAGYLGYNYWASADNSEQIAEAKPTDSTPKADDKDKKIINTPNENLRW